MIVPASIEYLQRSVALVVAPKVQLSGLCTSEPAMPAYVSSGQPERLHRQAVALLALSASLALLISCSSQLCRQHLCLLGQLMQPARQQLCAGVREILTGMEIVCSS